MPIVAYGYGLEVGTGGIGAIVENLIIELGAAPDVEVDQNPVEVDVAADIVVTLDQPVDVEVDVN